jgi:glycosyltransferase involved in cell wall biosynthesis
MVTFFWDVSGLFRFLEYNNRPTGIQRVVLALIDRCARQVGQEQTYLAWYEGRSGCYRTVAFKDLPEGALLDTDILCDALKIRAKKVIRGEKTLAQYRSNRAKFLFHRALLDLEAAFGGSRRLRKFNITAEEWRLKCKPRQKSRQIIRSVRFESISKKGDCLLILDTFYNSGLAHIFEKAAEKGLNINVLVHDTIPLTHPPLVPDFSPFLFHDWLQRSASYTSRFLANSQATRRDLERFLEVYDIRKPIAVVPLAQDRLPVAEQKKSGPLICGIDTNVFAHLHDIVDLDAQVRAIAATPFVLCVGTLENRKNIWRIALAWERLRSDYSIELPRLVFAGKRGWRINEFNILLDGGGNCGGYIEIVAGPSDRELDYLYRHSLFCIQASLAEGWGLTVGEALSYGKTSVVAQMMSLPEVGGDMVEYCDPLSVASITAACRRLIADEDHRCALEARISRTRLRSWDDVASDFIAAVVGKDVEQRST